MDIRIIGITIISEYQMDKITHKNSG